MQGVGAVAIGNNAAPNVQGTNAVAIGNSAGYTMQGVGAVAIGFNAAPSVQGTGSVAIGNSAGRTQQGVGAVAIGNNAAPSVQGTNAVAIGINAAFNTQGSLSVAIGSYAGYNVQGGSSVAIGQGAGFNTQGSIAVAVGNGAGGNAQGASAVAIGNNAGQNTQGIYSVSIGDNSGNSTQGQYAIAIGANAGQNNQGTNAVAIGKNAGLNSQAANTIILNATGTELSGVNGQTNSLYIDPIRNATQTTILGYDPTTKEVTYYTGSGGSSLPSGTNYGDYLFWNGATYVSSGEVTLNGAVPLGPGAGQSGQDSFAVAIGAYAGNQTQGAHSIAIGYFAGYGTTNPQAPNTIILNASGVELDGVANQTNSLYIDPIRNATQTTILGYDPTTKEVTYYTGGGGGGVPSGNNYGDYLYWDGSTYVVSGANIVLGPLAGQNGQGANAVAVGENAGNDNQGQNAIAIGLNCAFISQGMDAIAVGYTAGRNSQGTSSIAIGTGAGYESQTENSIAIGSNAGHQYQGSGSIAIGFGAGNDSQFVNAIAIGTNAGGYGQGYDCIAIGNRAAIGINNAQASNTIILNATGNDLDGIIGQTNSLYIAPIRGAADTGTLLSYNASTFEVTTVSKTFVIQHPDYEDKYLVHACLEGPEAGVYYRGEGVIKEKKVSISLPDYVKNLATELTVHVTPIVDDEDIEEETVLNLRSTRVRNNSFTVYANHECAFHWVVYGKRMDVKAEVDKSDVVMHGDGPYKWLETK